MIDFSTLQSFVNNKEIVSCHQYKDGTEGDVYEIDTMNGAFVAKCLSKSRILRYPNTISNEIQLLAFLKDNNIAAPLVYGSSNNRCIYYSHINGEQVIPNFEEIKMVVHYLKSLYSCNTQQLGFLSLMGFDTIYTELQESMLHEPFYNKRLQEELVCLNWDTAHTCLSHGDFHHGNMIWTNNHDRLTLIDWDEARLSPIEYDISRFFVSHSIYSSMTSAIDFLNECRALFYVNKNFLSFFIHYNAYFCLIRFKNWHNCFWDCHNKLTYKDTKNHLESLIISCF